MLAVGHVHDAQGRSVADSNRFPAFQKAGGGARGQTLRKRNLRTKLKVHNCVVEVLLEKLKTYKQRPQSGL